MKKLAIGLLVGLFFCSNAFAVEVSTTLAVRTTIGTMCTVSTEPVVFSGYDGTQEYAASMNGRVNVSCTPGTVYHIAMDCGQYLGLVYEGVRSLSNGSEIYLPYVLGMDPSQQTEWGDADYGDTYPNGQTVEGTSGDSHIIYALLGGLGEVVPEGTYSDIVNVTVHY